MDTDSLHDTTVSVVDGDPGGSTEAPSNDNGILEEISSNKEVMREIGSDLIRLELDLACCSEKLVNMNLLMMHVAAKECDFEAFTFEKGEKSFTSAVAAVEFDILSGFLDLEVKEMDSFLGKLHIKFNNACDAISSCKHLGQVFINLEEKRRDAEKSLKQSQEQVSELICQSVKFQRIVLSANRGETYDEEKDMAVEENGEFFNTTAKLQMHTSEQQRHILRMLEKSLARELDLENQLSECMQDLDKMKHKLHYSHREVLSAEEETAAVYARFLEADNASAVLMGISRELSGQLQSCQLTINTALCRESELNTKLQSCMQSIKKLEKEQATSQDLAEKNNFEALLLKEKVSSLEEQPKASEGTLLNESVSMNDHDEHHGIKALEEKAAIAESRAEKAEAECKLLSITTKELNKELDILRCSGISRDEFDSMEKQLRETEFQLQQAMASMEASQEKQSMYSASIDDMEIVIERLKTNVQSTESRAENAECECSLLGEANKELKMELDFVKANSICSEKVVSLEMQLRETDSQLQQATKSVEASLEKQAMLRSSIKDMEILIEKLKSKLLNADARADSAEDKCIILSESHAELNEELYSLRFKVEHLESCLQQAEEKKLATAKDINIRTKVITDLVVQLALERERLQKQISLLMEENRILVDRLKTTNKASSRSVSFGKTEIGVPSSDHRARSSGTGRGDRNIPGVTEVDKPADNVLNGKSNADSEELNSKLETVRTIDAGRLPFRYILSASLIALVAALATCILSPENCPFR